MHPTPARLYTLDNGLRVVVAPDRVGPVVAVNLWYDVGSRHEVPGRTGLAHLFEHLMFEGSRQVAAGAHFELVTSAGGRLGATTSTERTNYFESVPVEHLDLVLWLEADRMGSLPEALTDVSLEKQRDVVRNERRQRYDNVPYGSWLEVVTTLLFPEGHPYHHLPIGSMADLAAATLDDARAFFARHYSPDNAVLTIVGDVDPDEAVARVAHYFDSIPAGSGADRARAVVPLDPLGGEIRRTLVDRVRDRAWYLGYRLPPEGDSGLEHLEVAFAMLGLGRASLLESEVVHADIARNASAFIDRRVAGASFGAIFAVARAGVAVDDLEAAVLEQVTRLATDGPTAVELARAKAMLERRWLDRMAGIEGRADALSRATTLFGSPARAGDAVSAQLAASAEDVQAAVAALLDQPPVVVAYEPAQSEAA